MNKILVATTMVFFLLLTLSCSDNSSGPDDNGLGEASFTIAGDLEGEKTGIANFRAFEMSGIYTWDILIQDTGQITYDISFSMLSDEAIERPEPGTYDIALSGFGGEDFNGSYSDYNDSQFNPTNYTVGISSTSGTLNITNSSEDLVEGTFQFTAVDADSGGTITVSEGEFSAVPRISPN